MDPSEATKDELLVEVIKLQKRNEELEKLLELVSIPGKVYEFLLKNILALSSAVRQAEPDTANHQDRVAVLAREIALELDLEPEVVDTIGIAAQLHDIGKIGRYVLPLVQFKGCLNEDQWRDMRSHPAIGAQILRSFDCPWRLYPIVWGHHERLDGSGYPEGKKGDDISLPTAIVCVADVVEAMSTPRPYRPDPPGLDMALEHIFQTGGVLFHPDAVDACLSVFVKKGFDFPGAYIQ